VTTTVLTAKFDFSQPKSATKQTAAQMDQLKNKAKGAQGQLDNTAGSAKGAGAAAAFLGKASKGAVPGVAALGTALKAALGPIALLTSAAGVLTSAFATLAQQDFAEAKVRSLGVDSEKLTKQLAGVSRELAGQASVTELTGAAYDVASAGFTDAAAAANILKAASQGATGGFSDINTVGDATTSVLNAYGLEADKAAKLVDGFIQTQNDGKIVIGEYAANIAKVAPVAAALGVPLEEVNAAVAQITAGGQGAEVTFTALKTAFAQVAAGKVGEEFKDLGIEISAASLKSDGLAGTLQKIKDSGADAGTVIKAFGTEAGPSILALLNDTEKFNRLLENQKNAQGAAAAAAFEASDTINGALKRLQTAFTNVFADGAELGLLLKSTFKVAAVTVEFLGAALKATLAPIRGLIAGVQAFFQELAPFGENINLAYELEKAFQAFMGAVSFATDAVTGLFTVIGKGVATEISKVLNLATSIKEGVIGIFNNLGTTIRNALASLYDNLPDPIKFIIDQAGKGFKAVTGFLGEAVSGVVGQIKGAGQGIAQGVKELAVIGGFNPAASAQTASPAAAANSIQQTGGVLAKAAGETKPEGKTELQKQKEAAAALVQQLTRKNELDSLATDEARKLKQLEFDKADIAAKFPLLKQKEIEALQQLLQDNYNITEEKRKQAEADKKAKEAADKMKALYKSIGDTISTGVHDAIMGAVEGTKTLGEVASGVLRQISSQLMKFALGSIGGGGILGAIGDLFKANGGPVSAGKPYIVGERGPEVFTPSRSGTIIPNHAMGVGGGTSIVVNVDASGSSAQGDGPSANQLGKAIGAAVQAELIKQKRPGGLLTR
tara:strand:- start:694 stop:3207 length:2514 start_codon:yes stop_codon:yes gene_type:complete